MKINLKISKKTQLKNHYNYFIFLHLFFFVKNALIINKLLLAKSDKSTPSLIDNTFGPEGKEFELWREKRNT